MTRSDRGRLLVGIVSVATLVSLIWASWAPLASSIRDTIQFQRLGYHERRVRQLGAFYSSLTTLRTQVAPDEPLALITPGASIDAALFANYYLYPHPLRIYGGRETYRNTANDPGRPRTIVAVGDLVERATYGEIRNRELRGQWRLSATAPLSEPRRQFTLPIAASIDGPEPDTYVIEGTLHNAGSAEAIVDLTFLPSGRSSRITIAARSSFDWYDLIYQQFQVMEIGWLKIDSNEPVSGAFSFVNRGRSNVVALPMDVHPGPLAALVPSGRDTKLWLLNLDDQPATIQLASDLVVLKAHELLGRPHQGRVPPIEAKGVYAFLSTRDSAGRTQFLWPILGPKGATGRP